ncbi:TauD/TfdA dioxygenase family protein [Candidatus Entotheonella palauensis]|nr:TauD/TfdA family dioxygenase [Candidatus Entotheonella palauensis]
MTASADAVDVRPLSVHIGAEIHGVDLSRPLAPEEVQGIRAALLKWKVVFFREQFLDHQMQIDFARQFGELTPGHVVFGNDDTYPEIYSVAKHRKANRYRGGQTLQRPWTGWHADITAAINPPAASILRGDIVPPYGGDTQWTNLVAAYNALSPTMQSFIDGLRGEHRFTAPQGVQASNEYNQMVGNRLMVSHHPLVRVHPETGEKVLYVSPSFLKSIVGLTPRESQQILELLWEHSVRTEFTVRFKWESGSIAFWDNRSVTHLAPSDIFDTDFDRQFYRVTIMGDVPVGVDGSPSTAIEGNPITAV